MTEDTKTIEQPTQERPEDYFETKYGYPSEEQPTDKKLFMSDGLLRRLASSVSMEEFGELYMNPALQAHLLKETIMPRSERGKPFEDQELLENYLLTTEEGEKILEWVVGHILYFFTITTQKGSQALNPTGYLKKLMDLTSGLQASMVEKQSAGPTTAN